MSEIDLDAMEIWETTVPGTTYVQQRDPRNPRGWVTKKVGGRGTKQLRITVEERLFNQELVIHENQHHDPFTNGSLVRIHPKDERQLSDMAMTDAQIIEYLKLEDDPLFTEWLEGMQSEVVLRRALELARKACPMYRYEEIEQLVSTRYAIGKTSQVVREAMEDDARHSQADL